MDVMLASCDASSSRMRGHDLPARCFARGCRHETSRRLQDAMQRESGHWVPDNVLQRYLCEVEHGVGGVRIVGAQVLRLELRRGKGDRECVMRKEGERGRESQYEGEEKGSEGRRWGHKDREEDDKWIPRGGGG